MTQLVVDRALLFDGTSDELREAAVVVDDGVVTEVVAPGASPGDARVVLDAAGRCVTPGWIDAHCHAYGVSLDTGTSERLPLSYVALAAAPRLRGALVRGFTTIRDVAGGDAGLAAALADGLLPGPRYLWTGPGLSQTGGHGDSRDALLEPCGCRGHIGEVVDGVDALRTAVRDRFRRGAHAIKVFASGGVVSPTDPLLQSQYSDDELAAVADEAARRGSYVAAHAYAPDAVASAVRAGIRSIEHGNLIEPATAALMAEHGAWLVPTLVTYDAMTRRGAALGLSSVAQEKLALVRDAGLAAVGHARAAGVDVGLGTDLMGALEDDQLGELRLRCEVDAPLDVLRSATSGNAALLRHEELGRVAPGAAADMVVLPGDPRQDPSVLWSAERVVVQAGQVVAADGRLVRTTDGGTA